MSREVRRKERTPLILTADDVDPEKGDVAVCRCGLSDEHPFCDGSHRAAADEDAGVYRYVEGERRRVARAVFADGETIEYPTGTDGDGSDDGDDSGDSNDGDGGDGYDIVAGDDGDSGADQDTNEAAGRARPDANRET